MTSPTGSPITDSDQYCYRHPDRVTGVRCTRCERPICPDCMRPASVGFQCPECVSEGAKTIRQARTIYGGRVNAGSQQGILTQILIGINVVMFIYSSATGTFSVTGNGATSKIFNQLSLNPVAVGHGEWYRLVTAMFLHIDLIHIGFNMYALYLVGPTLETFLGRTRYLALYFIAGVGGSVLSVALGPLRESAAGASGAIFGLFAAFYVVARHQRLQTGGIAATIVFNLVFSFTFHNQIDWRGHVGGMIAGGLVMLAFAYAPRGSHRTALQAVGVAAVAVVVAAVGLLGAHRASHDCPDFQEAYLAGGVYNTATGCPASASGFVSPFTGNT